MKTTLAKVTGLALIAASFAFCGSLAYADTEDTTSIQVLTFDAVGNPGEIIAALDCDTGEAATHTVRADHTCTFATTKVGFTLPAAKPYTGIVHVCDIGVPPRLIREVAESA